MLSVTAFRNDVQKGECMQHLLRLQNEELLNEQK